MSKLIFSSIDKALQHLSNITDSRIIIAGFEQQKPHLKKELEKHNAENIDETLDQIMQADPVAVKTKGKKSPFTKQITKWLVNNKIKLPEDIETVKETLQTYNKNKSKIDKPITSFDSPGDVRKELDKHIEKDDEEGYENVAELIDTDGEYKLYKVDNYDQGKICFEDSGWCVKEEEEDFDEYKPPFYMVTKGKKRYALMHVDSHSLKDVYDNTLTMEQASPIKKFILKLFPKYRSIEDLGYLIGLYGLTEKEILGKINKDSSIIKYIDSPTEEMQLVAVRKNGRSIRFIVEKGIDPSKQVKKEAVKKDSYSIEYIDNPSEELQELAFKKNQWSIGQIKNPSEKIQLKAVKKNTELIDYIKKPTERVQLEAVKRNGFVIGLITKKGIKPSEEVQLAAVEKDPSLIKHIKNPTEKVKQLAEKLSKQKAASIKFVEKEFKMNTIKFATTQEALQYLSDYTDSRVVVASSIKPNKDGKYIPPKSAQNAAKKALKWKEEHPKEVKGGTRVGWTRARQLANGDALSLDIVKRMAQFNRHKENSKIDPKYKSTPWKDRGYCAWLGWGGTTGVNWAKRVVESQKNNE